MTHIVPPSRLPANVWVLAATQALGMSSTSMMILISGLLGTQLAPNAKLATLPTAMVVVGTATSALWVPLLLQRIGRKRGTLAGFIAALLATLCGGLATIHGSFALLLAASYGFGMGVAFWQQLRFAALECVADPKRYGAVLSLMMSGGLASAFLGPEIGASGRDLFSTSFTGSFVLQAGLLVVGLIVFQFYREPPRVVHAVEDVARPLGVIVRSPRFLIAALAAAGGFGVMSFIMTATPINMNELCGIPLADTKRVIQGHIIAMFAPSLVSGWLLARFGITRLMAAGAAAYGVVIVIGLIGQELMHFWGSLLLLGVGWNFLFICGTAQLPACHTPSEKFKTQAANDLLVFGSQAIASLSAGWFLFGFGWSVLLMAAVPVVLGLIALAWWRTRLPALPNR